MTRRRGATLVEVAVALFLVALVGLLVVNLRVQGAKRSQQLEAGTDQVRAALLLRAYLLRDLRHGLPRDVLSESERALDEAEGELIVPLYGGYDGDATPSLKYRSVRYRWVDKEGLYRSERLVLGQGLRAVRFGWLEDGTVLEATLVSAREKTPPLKLRFPLAAARDRGGWIRAPHHQGASRGDEG